MNLPHKMAYELPVDHLVYEFQTKHHYRNIRNTYIKCVGKMWGLLKVKPGGAYNKNWALQGLAQHDFLLLSRSSVKLKTALGPRKTSISLKILMLFLRGYNTYSPSVYES
jgi:hypothetical protein